MPKMQKKTPLLNIFNENSLLKNSNFFKKNLDLKNPLVQNILDKYNICVSDKIKIKGFFYEKNKNIFEKCDKSCLECINKSDNCLCNSFCRLGLGRSKMSWGDYDISTPSTLALLHLPGGIKHSGGDIPLLRDHVFTVRPPTYLLPPWLTLAGHHILQHILHQDS